MVKSLITNQGKLIDEVLPAIYFDSSLVIDYYMAESLPYDEKELDFDIDLPEGPIDQLPIEVQENLHEYLEAKAHPQEFLLREIINSDKRIKQVRQIRNKILFEDLKVNPVISPLVISELIKWFTETAFKQLASESVGSKAIQRFGDKQIGNYLKKLMELHKEARENPEFSNWKKEGLKRLHYELWMSPSFVYAHGLSGLILADIINFDLTMKKVWSEPEAYSFLQIGATDIMHILFAEHLGCEYIASFDDDFLRAKDIIKEKTGITVVRGYKEIMDIL